MNRKIVGVLVASVLLAGLVGAEVGAAAQRRASAKQQYMQILTDGDRLWGEYQKAIKSYHTKGKGTDAEHLRKIWEMQVKMSGLYKKWVDFPMQDLDSTDLKVGLAFQLQMSSMSAEMLGTLEGDQGYMDFADDLDKHYHLVIDDM